MASRLRQYLLRFKALAHKAYEDTALPIGQNQTISQPFVVALMTELLFQAAIPVSKVLEVGTGCGYQTAILSQLVKWVFTIERIGSLQQQARERLPELGYRNVSYLNGDGFEGWASNQPFDGILVAAAPAEVPESLLSQLVEGGRMIIPVGDGAKQDLKIVTKSTSGYREEIRSGVRFVPMLNGRKS